MSDQDRTINPYLLPKVRKRVRSRKKLSIGARLTFDALVDRAGNDGRCFPSISTIADDIAVQERRARHFVHELEAAGYCRRERAFDDNGRQTSNRFVFPWRPEYDDEGRGSDSTASPTRSDSTASPDVPIPTGGRGLDSTGTRRLDRTAKVIQIESNKIEGKSSSSSPDHEGSVVEVVDTRPATPTTIESAHGEQWTGTDDELQQVREALRSHYIAARRRRQMTLVPRGELVPPPDIPLAQKVMKLLRGPDDFGRWLWDLAAREVNIERWGFYPHDAREEWPGRRADVSRQVDARRAAMELEARATSQREADAAAECEAAELAERQERERQQEFIDAASARGWRQFHRDSQCPHCFGFGRRNLDGADICACRSGSSLKYQLDCARAVREREGSALLVDQVPVGATEVVRP